jgi:long-chain acyl-CoA synthetase
VSAYKVPKLIVEREELPRSLIGKVLRRVVREELKASQ